MSNADLWNAGLSMAEYLARNSSPPERKPLPVETDEGYDEAQQKIIDAMSEEEWNAALAEGRKVAGWAK
jgi:hypothetical protein